MVIFQERVVNLLQQLKMPIFETSLVFQKHINQLMKTLQEFALSTGQHIPDKIGEPWAIDGSIGLRYFGSGHEKRVDGTLYG